MTDAELLAVLDMEPDKQWVVIAEYLIEWRAEIWERESEERLAFRLRDEAVAKDRARWHWALNKVQLHAAGDKYYEDFWTDDADSIHTIIAALLALKGE